MFVLRIRSNSTLPYYIKYGAMTELARKIGVRVNGNLKPEQLWPMHELAGYARVSTYP